LIVLALELSPDKAAGLRMVFTTLGILLTVTIPLAFLIPDLARERAKASVNAAPRTGAEARA
jgi:hypothetical protein